MDKLVLLALLTSLVPTRASAQDSSSIGRSPDPVRIVQFRDVEMQPICFAGRDTSNVAEGKCHIRYGDTFIIVVNRLLEDIELADIQLVINDKAFPEYHPTSMVVNKNGVELFVTLDHVVDEGTTNLARYLGTKRHSSNIVWIGLAKKDGSAITSAAAPLKVVFWEWSWLLIIHVAVFLVFIFLLVRGVRKKDFLKESATYVVTKADGSIENHVVKKFSLAQVQMLMWTVLVLGMFFVLWTITGKVPVFNSTVMLLLGISFATGVASAAVPSPSKPRTVKQSFVDDIFSEGDGYSLHRFQMVVFAVSFALVFLSLSFYNMEFIEFDSTQLALMGISSASYVGLKATQASSNPVTSH